jgi:hypothetical protein
MSWFKCLSGSCEVPREPLPPLEMHIDNDTERRQRMVAGTDAMLTELDQVRIRLNQLEAEQRARFGIKLGEPDGAGRGGAGPSGHAGA